MKKMLLLSLLAMSLFSACKKDDPVTAEATLQARWTLQNTVVKEYVNSVLVYNTTIPGNGGIRDFQSNGNLVITDGTSVSTTPYTLLPGSKVQFQGLIFDIQSLTVSGVVLFRRDDYAPGEYDDIFITLSK